MFLRVNPCYPVSFKTRYAVVVFQGKYDKAAPLYERSAAIRENALGLDHHAQSLNDWAESLRAQVKTGRNLQKDLLQRKCPNV